eukprot:CAMPEP_0203684446 /NCGR_PEP_ID=MMETSP0090-20130426/48042_1 /ASSEMBLY_ACC=CAM_ASM_001088 /TAXON_ID=426623 /ORGANISM="Chaetoceros affinis, Strain CCMP159" /LENGTH=274 /DNA_ID=CAMNT_0050553621 /DNA_START=503 /DNA_END=1327 /DNA_ORIENTATION=-
MHGAVVKDFYKVLKIHRTASQNEIKDAYRKLAFSLHPDRHDGCQKKTNEFKMATEAYQTLSDQMKRIAHDKILNGQIPNSNNNRRPPPPPNYRKVYAPRPPPPGFKTFDAKYHYDMHYGDGMMKEELERARKRAEAASGRARSQFGHEYVSPLGKGFEFNGGAGAGGGAGGGNPYSRSGRRKMNNKNNSVGGAGAGAGAGAYDFEYEEGYMDMGGESFMSAKRNIRGREIVTERMKERRKFRRRNRGDPLAHSASANGSSGMDGDAGSASCTIM